MLPLPSWPEPRTLARMDIVSSSMHRGPRCSCPGPSIRMKSRPVPIVSIPAQLWEVVYTSPSNRKILKLRLFIFSCGEPGKQLMQFVSVYTRSKRYAIVQQVQFCLQSVSELHVRVSAIRTAGLQGWLAS